MFFVATPETVVYAPDKAWHLTKLHARSAAPEHLVSGMCRRYPETIMKAPADFCGEHLRPDSEGWQRMLDANDMGLTVTGG